MISLELRGIVVNKRPAFQLDLEKENSLTVADDTNNYNYL
jgi:hypothetical protein